MDSWQLPYHIDKQSSDNAREIEPRFDSSIRITVTASASKQHSTLVIHILGQKRGVHVTTQQRGSPLAQSTLHQSVVCPSSGHADLSTQLTSLLI